MLLSDDLRFIVQGDGDYYVEWEVDPTDPEFTQCIEVVSEHNDTQINVVKIADENVEAWLHGVSTVITPGKNRTEESAQRPRRTHILLLPAHGPVEYQTPFTNSTLRNSVCLAKNLYQFPSLLSVGPTQYFEVAVEDGGKGLVIKMESHNERDISSASMVATNADCTQTCAVVRVGNPVNLKKVLRRITDLKQCIWHPCVLASLQIELRLSRISRELRKLKASVEEMERSAGVYKSHILAPEYKRDAGLLQPWNFKDFDLLRNDLASVKSDLLYQKYKCTQFLELLGFLDDIACRMEDLPEYWIKSKFMKNTIRGYKERAQYLSDRVETTIQTCFSIMSQKDNVLNQQAAELNQKIAMQSLELTNLTRRDSQDMRAITIITLFFLPATFTATFFSTSFFDFKPDGQLATAWLWIYWVVTVVLTAAVLGGWYTFSRRLVQAPAKGMDVKLTEKEKRDESDSRHSEDQLETSDV